MQRVYNSNQYNFIGMASFGGGLNNRGVDDLAVKGPPGNENEAASGEKEGDQNSEVQLVVPDKNNVPKKRRYVVY